MRLLTRCVLVVMLLAAATARAVPWGNPLLYHNDFEAPAYVVGQTIVGKDGWLLDATENGGGGSKTSIESAAGHGKVLENYRASGQKVHHVYRSLDTVKDTGRATLSFDAKRYGSASNITWFYIDDDAGNTVSYFGMHNQTGKFIVFDGSGYRTFGSLSNNQWYRIGVDMRFSGDGAGTYDIVARGPNGGLAGEWLGQAFNNSGAAAGRLHVRTYGTGSGCQVDNIVFEGGYVKNKIMHGDFDGLAPGTAPDDGAPVGGWGTGDGIYAEGGDTTRVAIAVKPGPDPTDLALHVTKTGTSVDPAYAEQIFAKPYTQGPHKLIIEHEQVTTAGKVGADFGVADGSSTNELLLVGLRDEAAGANPYYVKTWPGGTGLDLVPWTPGETYTLRSSVDLETDTCDLYIRGGEYPRWTQIGKQLPYWNAGDFHQADRVMIGQGYKPCDAYVDNVVAVNSADLPVTIHHTNNFEDYTTGGLLGQDGWTLYWDQAGDPAANRCQIVPGPTGKAAAVTATTAGNGYTGLYQDLDCVVESGTALFTVDARWDRSSPTVGNAYTYFVLGDSEVLTGGSGYSPSAAIFGFRQGKFMIRPGDGSGGFGILLSAASTDPDTWYRFAATVHLTGDARKTWDLQVFNRDTGALLWDRAGVRFTTDYTDLTRLGLFVYDSAQGTLYFDNVDLRDIPEPATMLLLGGGLLALTRRRKRC